MVQITGPLLFGPNFVTAFAHLLDIRWFLQIRWVDDQFSVCSFDHGCLLPASDSSLSSDRAAVLSGCACPFLTAGIDIAQASRTLICEGTMETACPCQVPEKRITARMSVYLFDVLTKMTSVHHWQTVSLESHLWCFAPQSRSKVSYQDNREYAGSTTARISRSRLNQHTSLMGVFPVRKIIRRYERARYFE